MDYSELKFSKINIGIELPKLKDVKMVFPRHTMSNIIQKLENEVKQKLQNIFEVVGVNYKYQNCKDILIISINSKTNGKKGSKTSYYQRNRKNLFSKEKLKLRVELITKEYLQNNHISIINYNNYFTELKSVLIYEENYQKAYLIFSNHLKKYISKYLNKYFNESYNIYLNENNEAIINYSLKKKEIEYNLTSQSSYFKISINVINIEKDKKTFPILNNIEDFLQLYDSYLLHNPDKIKPFPYFCLDKDNKLIKNIEDNFDNITKIICFKSVSIKWCPYFFLSSINITECKICYQWFYRYLSRKSRSLDCLHDNDICHNCFDIYLNGKIDEYLESKLEKYNCNCPYPKCKLKLFKIENGKFYIIQKLYKLIKPEILKKFRDIGKIVNLMESIDKEFTSREEAEKNLSELLADEEKALEEERDKEKENDKNSSGNDTIVLNPYNNTNKKTLKGNINICPNRKCNTLVFRAYACNAVVCSKCGTPLCIVCGTFDEENNKCICIQNITRTYFEPSQFRTNFSGEYSRMVQYNVPVS